MSYVIALDQGTTSSRALLVNGEGEIVRSFRKTGELRGGWSRYEADFGDLSTDAVFDRMELRFDREGENFRFVNLEHPRLLK